MKPARQRFDDMPAPQQAGMLCNDQQFRKFVGARCIGKPTTFTAAAAAEYLRKHCEITSRADLLTNKPARLKFQTLRTDFEAWSGRIATPR